MRPVAGLILAATGFLLTPHLVLGSGFQKEHGAIVRGPPEQKRIALVFTGHEFAEGAETILGGLQRHKAKGSFFLTGDFLENPAFGKVVKKIGSAGHYLGPHSDKHLLYCSWQPDRKTLVTHEAFRGDLEENLRKIRAFVPDSAQVGFFLPAYEHCNDQVAAWTQEMGLTLVNLTPGTRSAADYTGEADTNFVSSQKILESILSRERADKNGLNGFILLFHIGAGPARSDKFHTRFGELLDTLRDRGYEFVRIDQLLANK